MDAFNYINEIKDKKEEKEMILNKTKNENNAFNLKKMKNKKNKINNFYYLSISQYWLNINIIIIIVFNYNFACPYIYLKFRKAYLISQITMTIKGAGKQKILSNYSGTVGYVTPINCSFGFLPDEIYINGKIQNYTDIYAYNLEKEINTVALKWNYRLTNCNVMFKDLKNIRFF